MKKLIAITLILALLLPAVALAADRDPIIGYWYAFFDGDLYPEFMPNFGDYDHSLIIYYFSSDGTVFALENNVKDGASVPAYMSCGKWEFSKLKYTCNIIGLGECEFRPSESIGLLTPQNANGIKMVLRKIVPFDPYNDYLMR